MDDFELELKQGFLEEAAQLLTDVEQCFLTLEQSPGDPATLDKIFRLAHNLKGSSKAVGFEDMGVFAHKFESFLLKVKNKEIPCTSPIVSLCLQCNDFFVKSVEALKADPGAKLDGEALVQEMNAFMNGEKSAEASASATADTPMPEAAASSEQAPASTPEIFSEAGGIAAVDATGEGPKPEEIMALNGLSTAASEQNLEAQIAQETNKQVEAAVNSAAGASATSSNVVPMVAPAASPVAVENKPAPTAEKKVGGPAGPQADESIRVSLSRLERLVNFVGEMVILQTVLQQQTYSGNMMSLRKTVHQLGKVTKEVQDLSMGLRMVPVKQTFQKMQRIVRDTASTLNKKIIFNMSGEETELDKTVLENLGDPLVHMIRNAVDHGIESAELRKERGKPEAGTVNLSAYHRSGKLVIEIKDDGGGIDGKKLNAKAIEKGILKPGTVLPEKEAVHLIFAAGFSTKTEVTEVSGRGVGMDVVRKNIEKLQGEVIIDTVVGQGTTFQIILPLTLAIIDGMIVRVDQDRFVLPLSHMHESLRPATGDVKKATNMGEILFLRGENLPLFRLSALIGKKSEVKPATDCIAIIVRTQATPFAVLVDDIIGQHQVVIKKLGGELSALRGYSGSAILGDGKPALILELPDLVQRKTGVNTNDSSRRATA